MLQVYVVCEQVSISIPLYSLSNKNTINTQKKDILKILKESISVKFKSKESIKGT